MVLQFDSFIKLPITPKSSFFHAQHYDILLQKPFVDRFDGKYLPFLGCLIDFMFLVFTPLPPHHSPNKPTSN
jgi:hypothetical protein